MRHPILRTLLPVVSGALCFLLGWWTGSGKGEAPVPASEESREGIGGRGGSFIPGRSMPPEDGGGGAAGGGAIDRGAKGEAAGLDSILENPDRRVRERDLEVRGARDFAEGADWKANAARIGDLVDRGAYLKGAVAAWAAENPRETVAYLSTLSLSERANLIPHAVSVWADLDPASAEGWVIGLAHGEVRDLAVESLYRAWAVNDPAAAAARSLELKDESARLRSIAAVVREWSVNDLGSAGKWAANLKDPNLKDFAIMAVADEMSARAPREAMRWTSEHLANDPQANLDIVQLVASKAGFEAPRETFDWLKTVPPSPEAAASLAGVATYLAEEDPNFAWDGFAKLPEELKRVTADSVASILGMQDPEGGKRWLDQLADGETRRWATSAFASGWAARDPAAAEAWAAGLPPGPEKEAANEGLSSTDFGSGAGGRVR